jgi:hypothetical protein
MEACEHQNRTNLVVNAHMQEGQSPASDTGPMASIRFPQGPMAQTH